MSGGAGRVSLSLSLSLVVSLAAILGGILVLAVTTARGQDLFQTIGRDIASLLISLGLVTIVYDHFLREAHAREILERVGLRQRLVDVGIWDVNTEADTPWRSYLEAASSFSVLLADPSLVIGRIWPLILAAGRQRTVHVSIFLPSPDSALAESVAARVGLSSKELADRVDAARRSVEEGWNSARTGPSKLRKGSQITVAYYESFPGYEFVLGDQFFVFLLSGALGRMPEGDLLSLVFNTPATRFPRTWLDQQLRLIPEVAATTAFENVVR